MHNTKYTFWVIKPELMHVGFPGIVTKVYPYPGYCATVLQKSQKFWVRVWSSYRTYRSSGYGTELLQNSQNFRVLWHGRTELRSYKSDTPVPRVFVALAYELPEVPGTSMTVVQNFQKFLVRV